MPVQGATAVIQAAIRGRLRNAVLNSRRVFCPHGKSGLYLSCVPVRLQRFREQENRMLYHTSRERQSQVELTSIRYPEIKRGNYAMLQDRDVAFFQRLLDQSQVVTDADDLESYNTDWMRTVRGASRIVLRPRCTEEVSAIMQYCSGQQLAVCPQGGNTGSVGGSVPVFDEVILSTALMNKVISLDHLSGILVCEAGCILEKLDNYVEEHGLIMPIDLGGRGSCHIGGNISTNAGGPKLLRYGNLHGNILGLEVVLANGEVLDCMSCLKKDNTGYALKHLFIGSEGTLGFITKAAIQCPARPTALTAAFLGLQTFSGVLDTLSTAKRYLGEVLSSCEFMDWDTLNCLQTQTNMRLPVQESPFYMLVECSGSCDQHDQEKITQFLEKVMEKSDIVDGTMATSPSHIQYMWEIRDMTAAAFVKEGYIYTYDISLPLNCLYDIVTTMRQRLGSDVHRCCGYGHVGDGNLHLEIIGNGFDLEVLNKIEPFIYEWTAQHSGSISAEHGLGIHKKKFIHYSKSENAIRLMQELKQLLDPQQILNPYKVLP